MFNKAFIVFTFLLSQNILSQDIIYPISLVDRVPVFGVCQQFNEFQQKKCFEDTIKSHIQNNIQFPAEAFELGISGRVLVYFTIDSNGKIDEIRSRGPHELLKNEALRLISILPQVSPAKKDNIAVKISYSLPIDFFLVTRPSSSDIRVFAGANVYSKTDKKSEIVAVIRNNSRWSASTFGDFWMIDYVTGIGYISKEDVTTNIESKENIRQKNDIDNLYETNFDNTDKISELNKNNEEIKELDKKDLYKEYIESKTNDLINENEKDTSKEVTMKPIQIQDKKNSVLPSNPRYQIIKEYESDLSTLENYKLKVETQEKINRKIPGTNQGDIYYTNALNQFLKIFTKELNIKYNIKSYENPEAFNKTRYKVKNIKSAQRRVERLRSEDNKLTLSFFNKQFNNPPNKIFRQGLKEIIDEIMKLEYIDIESLKNITEERVVKEEEDIVTKKEVVAEKEDLITKEEVVTEKEDLITEEEVVTEKEDLITNTIEAKLENYLDNQNKEVNSDSNNEIKQELEEVREMLSEMKDLIQMEDQEAQVEEKKIDINDLAKDLIDGNISQEDFFSKLELLDETKNNNELISSIKNLKSIDDFLNLNILTQSIKMKSELLKSIGDVNNFQSEESTKADQEEISCTDFTSFNYTDGRQNIVSANKFNIVNNSDKLSIYPILGSSKSSILVNIKIEGKEMCFDSDSKILVSFRDGSSTEILHDSYDNCNGETVIFLGRIFGNKAFQDLNELKYKEVEKIRIWMKNSLKELTLSRIQSQELMFTIDCLSSYMN